MQKSIAIAKFVTTASVPYPPFPETSTPEAASDDLNKAVVRYL
jgi:hypothetical protein